MNAQTPRRSPSRIPSAREVFHSAVSVLLVLSLTGCGLADTLKNAIGFGASTADRTLNILDGGIARLDNNSAEWQSVLEDMQSKLTTDAQSTIRNEITQLIQRSVEAVSSNIKCIIDLVGTRVKENLLRIRAELLGVPAPAIEPFICTSIPSVVDMSLSAEQRNRVELYGFDFDTTPAVQVALQNASGSVDVSQDLDRPTQYLMTLNLGASGIPVNATSQRLVLNWQGKVISTIAVIQPQTPVCQTKSVQFTPPSITYLPPKIGSGDAEFGGNGPDVTVSVNLTKAGNSVDARIYMRAIETKSDWTEAAGTITKQVYIAPPGWTLESIDSPLNDSVHYVDTNIFPDNFNGGGPVAQFVITGDTEGDDAGRTTKADISFNEMKMTLLQVGDCVSPGTLVQAVGQSKISPLTLQRLGGAVPAAAWSLLPREQLQKLNPDLLKMLPSNVRPLQLEPSPTP
jgi:hypothetical protein